MSVDDWTWTCSGCGSVSHGETAADAQTKFLLHAALAHPKATILSVNTEVESNV